MGRDRGDTYEIGGILSPWQTLHLDLSVNYDDRDGAGQMSGSSKSVEKNMPEVPPK